MRQWISWHSNSGQPDFTVAVLSTILLFSDRLVIYTKKKLPPNNRVGNVSEIIESVKPFIEISLASKYEVQCLHSILSHGSSVQVGKKPTGWLKQKRDSIGLHK